MFPQSGRSPSRSLVQPEDDGDSGDDDDADYNVDVDDDNGDADDDDDSDDCVSDDRNGKLHNRLSPFSTKLFPSTSLLMDCTAVGQL